MRRAIVGVSGLCPGLVAWLPGEPGRVKRRGLRAWVIGAGWWRLTRAGESGRERVGGHGALGIGRRFAFGVPAWEEAPVIHPVARGGPECRAVLGGSINPTAVLIDAEKEARRRSELARACTSRPRARECGVSWRWSCGLGQLLVVTVFDARLVEAADLAVAQAVVAEGEDLPGDRDLGDVAPAAFGDPLEGGAQWTAAGRDLLRGFGQRPAQRGRSLAGDVPQPGFGVGAAHGRREPGPGAQMPGGRESG
jgi:hypothetical protein